MNDDPDSHGGQASPGLVRIFLQTTTQWFGTETIAVKVAADAFTIFIAVLLEAYVSVYLYGKGRKGNPPTPPPILR